VHLGELAVGHENNCNLIRMLAAQAVLFSHSFVLATGRDADQPLYLHLRGVTLGSIAVDVFFVLSGFLVCGSLIARQELRSFLRARALRVYPGLIASVVLTVVVLTASLKSNEVQAFLTSSRLWMFVAKNTTLLFGVYPLAR
jgi:peptidoglycan/LPS O-acetylase OafA/YrhL